MRTRARLEILNAIIMFGTNRNYEERKSVSFDHDGKYAFSGRANDSLIKGDLVKLSLCGTSKYYLSWFHEKRCNEGWPEYLLESIDDGSFCWWSNVEICFFNRETLVQNEDWKWDDDKFAFRDKIFKCATNSNRKYAGVVFNEDGSAEVRSRGYFESYEGVNIVIPNWKKCTNKVLKQFFNSK